MCRFSGVFLLMEYILYIARDSLTEVHVLAAFIKEWLSFACDVIPQWKILTTFGCPSANFWNLIYPMSITALLSILTWGSLEAFLSALPGGWIFLRSLICSSLCQIKSWKSEKLREGVFLKRGFSQDYFICDDVDLFPIN